MDRLEEFQVFLAVFEAGSMAAAAQKLRRSASAVTRLLTSLEQRMGVRLFERSTRSLTPTNEGLRLVENARQVLAQYELAVRQHSEAPPRGLLRMTAPVVFGRRHMAPVVTKFLTRYPDIQIDLNLTDRNQDLIENGIDLALRIGALDSSGLVARKLGLVRRFTVASPQYLERCGEPLTPEALARHELILNTGIRGLAQWRYRMGNSEHVVRFAPRLQLNDVEAILDAARAGFGIARALSYQVAPDLQAGTLQRLLCDFEQEPLPVHLVLPSARHMAPRQRVFVDFAVQEFAQLKLIC